MSPLLRLAGLCGIALFACVVAAAGCSSSDDQSVSDADAADSSIVPPREVADGALPDATTSSDSADARDGDGDGATSCADVAAACTGRCGTVMVCGQPVVCGDCPPPGRCVVATNRCECNDIHACSGGRCGSITDSCGKKVDCGNCTTPDQCAGGDDAGSPGELQNVCSCPKTFDACAGKCGTFFQCGRTQFCSSCPGQQICGHAQPNVCGGCQPKVCNAFDNDCGAKPDGCGGTLNCPSCRAPNSCGGFGEPFVCGGCVYLGIGGSCPAGKAYRWSCAPPGPPNRGACDDYTSLQPNQWCCP